MSEKNINITNFSTAAKKHAEATECGDYKAANKQYNIIKQNILIIKQQNKIKLLLQLIKDPSIGVRLWAATFLLPIEEEVAMETLRNISLENNIHSLTADTTLKEWQKGNLAL